MFEKELTKRQIQAQNTKDLIYKTAIEMMELKGFQNLKVEEICKTAGVSVGSFYNCFKTKYELLDEVFNQLDIYIMEVAPIKLQEGSAVDKVINFFDIYADYNIWRGLDFTKHLYGVQNNLFKKKGRKLQIVLQNIIEEGQNCGEFNKDMTPDEAVDYLFVAVRGAVYNWCLYDGEYDLKEYIKQYVKKLIQTLIAR